MNRLLLSLLLLAPFTAAQTGSGGAPNLSLAYTLSDGVSHPLLDGAAIAFPAVDIQQVSDATIDVVNQGTGAGTVTGISITGAPFRITGGPALPASIPGGQSLRFAFRFVPVQPGTYTGTFRIDLSGRSVSGTLSASTAPSKISLAYIDPDTNNVLPLSGGSALQFPNTYVGTTVTITLLIANNGAGTGTVSSIALSGITGSVFQLSSLPALPVAVPPAQQVRFGIRFSPQQLQTFSAALTLNVDQQTTSFNLLAQAIGPRFVYTYGTSAAAIAPGGTFAFADTALGQTSSVTVSVTNSGTGDGQIPSIIVSGDGLSLSNLPLVPLTLHAGDSQHFTLTFAPTQPGSIEGRLAVGGDNFAVSATGIGARLTFTFASAGTAVPVADGGVVIFAPIEVGKSESLDFTMQNTGTGTATISSIALAAGSTFSLPQLPAVPLNLAAGNSLTVPLRFTPNNTGSLTATLRVNSSAFTLSGSGTQPPAIPTYQFQMTPVSPIPAEQPRVGLTFAASYPQALQGTLQLTFLSDVFTDDPAIQFATGGRTVNFVVPANSTQALFNGSSTIPLQTGTTAGTIVVTPSFALQSGFDLTPPSPDPLSLTIPRAAPQLQTANIQNQTLSSFSLVLSGFSTTRGLRQFDIDIAAKSGARFAASHLTVDVGAASATWYQSSASLTTGGSFLVAIPVTLQNGSTSDDLVHMIQSLTVTATNEAGVSSAIAVAIP